jgi:hypothetical protein
LNWIKPLNRFKAVASHLAWSVWATFFDSGLPEIGG